MIINQHKRRIFIGLAIAAISVFGSCSKQISSMAHLKKLDSEQDLTIAGAKTSKTQKKADCLNISRLQLTAISASPTTAIPEENYSKAEHKKKSIRLLTQLAPKKFAKTIQNQTAAIRNLYSDRHTSAYSKTFDTGGFLGLAVLCLIAAIVLAYFGFHALAALLWVIGIILFAAAILFFILWLIGRAVAD